MCVVFETVSQFLSLLSVIETLSLITCFTKD